MSFFAKTFFEMKDGQRRVKPQMVIVLSVISFVAFVGLVYWSYQSALAERKTAAPFANRPALPPQNLDYNIVKLDTISLSDYFRSSDPMASSAQPSASSQQQQPRSSTQREIRRQPSAPQTITGPTLPSTPGPVVDRNPNMIVVSNMGKNEVSSGSLLGLETALVKVILPEKTAITNSSLVEARVLNETNLGRFVIPRRAQLVGIATLQNSRVLIDFRELRINNVTHTCSGRAFDLKKLPGLPYTALDDRARKVILDELKSAVAAIPVIGRYANQSEINPFNEEVATLEEGLEFYAQVTNIF